MTTDRELMQQALDALDLHAKQYPHMVKGYTIDAARALRARLAQPEQEPVAWMYEYGTDHGDAVNQIFWHKNLRLEKPTGLVRNVVPLYTAPPQREWQGLTDEEIKNCFEMSMFGTCRAIEAKLKAKNA